MSERIEFCSFILMSLMIVVIRTSLRRSEKLQVEEMRRESNALCLYNRERVALKKKSTVKDTKTRKVCVMDELEEIFIYGMY